MDKKTIRTLDNKEITIELLNEGFELVFDGISYITKDGCLVEKETGANVALITKYKKALVEKELELDGLLDEYSKKVKEKNG